MIVVILMKPYPAHSFKLFVLYLGLKVQYRRTGRAFTFASLGRDPRLGSW